MFPTDTESKDNERRVLECASSLERPADYNEMARAILDLALIQKITQHPIADPLPGEEILSFSIVFHGSYGLSLGSAHLSTPAVLHNHQRYKQGSETPWLHGSVSLFNYSHYHDATLGPIVYASVARVRGEPQVPDEDSRSMWHGAISELIATGMALPPRRPLDGEMHSSISFDAAALPSRLSWPPTAECLKLALQDTTGTVFIGKVKERLTVLADEMLMSSVASFGSQRPRRIL